MVATATAGCGTPGADVAMLGAMRDRRAYDADPSTLEHPLSPDEVRYLMSGDAKGLARDRRALMHFLQRVLVTIEGAERQIAQLHTEVQRMQVQINSGAGRRTTMDPATAVQFAPREVVMQYADGLLRDKINIVERKEQTLDRTRAAVQQAIDELDADPSVSDDAVARVAAALGALGVAPSSGQGPGSGDADGRAQR